MDIPQCIICTISSSQNEFQYGFLKFVCAWKKKKRSLQRQVLLSILLQNSIMEVQLDIVERLVSFGKNG